MDDFLNFLDKGEFIIGTVIGTLFIVLEWMTPYADDVEKFIDSMENKLRELGNRYTNSMFYQVLFTITIPATIFLIFRHIAEASPIYDITFNMQYVWICRVIAYTCYSFIGLYAVSNIIEFANKKFKGQALGGIGVMFDITALVLGLLDKILDT